MDYQKHLFFERDVRSVTANTRADGEELFRLAVALGVRPRARTLPFAAADRALEDLAHGDVSGATVLSMVARGLG
jgi:propanol-preferring alcohol dehydrogenase